MGASGDVTVTIPTAIYDPRAFARGPIGRPTICTPEVAQRVVEAIRATGAYIETAVIYAGISKASFYDWLKRGHAGRRALAEVNDESLQLAEDERTDLLIEAAKEAPYVAFLDAVEKAIAEAEIRDLAVVTRASASDWRASAWRLERRFPHRWGRHDRLDVNEGLVPASRGSDELKITVHESRALTKEEFLHGVAIGPGEG